ncbi:SDR family oxidoreductase [Chryseobacterium sp. WG14]|uniref:SDR family oxidoreductase n=1 Tax=unclassified Chryseobacterium TaxID=2593645 RepID=UPI00211EA022|nr:MULTISPECIES: SDR family oxidoreductase [unclassified Chryseobacterium]MCQ9636352.1 SDR family oxidoreductase [Chryseobacterium sp. WG23]MCQ9641528.1 SDR family oxidoreductase [Chryseobacterium sp. WG14]
MKVLVIGANGRVGSALVKKLADKDYEVLAGSRKTETAIAHPNIMLVHIDLLSDVETLSAGFRGADAIYFVSGSRGKNLLQIDLHGAVKTMQAAERAGIKRYIMLSSVFALQPEHWNEPGLVNITDYNIAKHYADLYLSTQTQLDYTILQPGTLTDEPGTGKISLQVEKPMPNSISNVVDTLVAILENSSTIGKVILMKDGETPISAAFETL